MIPFYRNRGNLLQLTSGDVIHSEAGEELFVLWVDGLTSVSGNGLVRGGTGDPKVELIESAFTPSNTAGINGGHTLIWDIVDGENQLSVTINGTLYEWTVWGIEVMTEDRYLWLLEQWRRKLESDDFLAIFGGRNLETESLEINRVAKERVLRFMETEGFVGSYKSLLAILDTFGYGDLLRIEEIWERFRSGKHQELSTGLGSVIRNYIDSRISGFAKTNRIKLVYKINDEDGTFDDDGCPNYVNILYDTERVYVKLLALRRILVNKYLPLNVHLTEIQGEFQACEGIGTRIWNHNSEIHDVWIGEQVGAGVEISEKRQYVDRKLFLIRDTQHGESDPLTVDTDSRYNKRIFEIDRIISEEEETTLNDYDILTRFFSEEIGVVTLSVDGSLDDYREYRIEVWNEGVKTDDGWKPISELLETTTIGVRFIGDLTVGIRFKSLYGTEEFYGGQVTLEKEYARYGVMRAKDGVWRWRGDESFKKGIYTFGSVYSGFLGTYRDDAGDPGDVGDVIDPLDSGRVLRKYLLRPETWNFLESVRGQGQIGQFDQMNYWGYRYSKRYVDPSAGTFSWNAGIYESTVNWTVSGTPEIDAISCITAINTANSEIGAFTAQTMWVSASGDLISDGSLQVLVVCKIPELKCGDGWETFSRHVPIAGYTSFWPVDGLAGMSVSRVQEKYYSSLDIWRVDQLVNTVDFNGDTLSNLEAGLRLALDGIDASVINTGVEVIVSSREDISISHSFLGTHELRVRGLGGNVLVEERYGADYNLGEPLTAYVSEDYTRDRYGITWTLKKSGTTVVTQRGSIFRWFPRVPGIYTLELSSQSEWYGTEVWKIAGTFRVLGIPEIIASNIPRRGYTFPTLPTVEWPLRTNAGFLIDDPDGATIVDDSGNPLASG